MTSRDPSTSQPPTPTPKRREQNRREFLRTLGLGAGMLGLSLAGLYPVINGVNARLRPPGAIKDRLDEQKFIAACIKCGQCVQVCPVEAIRLADLLDGVGLGTPYIAARDQACDFSCDGLQCVLACPTGALTHEINYPAQARMGFARLSRPEACLAAQGKAFTGQLGARTSAASCGFRKSTAGIPFRWPNTPMICPCAISVSVNARSRSALLNAPPDLPPRAIPTNVRRVTPSPWSRGLRAGA